jgi:hypothetical protein
VPRPPFHKNYIIFRDAENFKKKHFSKNNLFWEGPGRNLMERYKNILFRPCTINYTINKLCNKQDGLFSSSKSYLHKGQGSPNKLKKTYKPFNIIKSYLIDNNIFIFYFLLQCQ